MRTLSFGNMILVFLIIISSRTVLSNDTDCKDIVTSIQESLSSLTSKVNEHIRGTKNFLDLLDNRYHNINFRQVNFQDKQDSLETQLRDILSEVKEIKEKSFAKETTLTEIHNDVKHTKEVLNMKETTLTEIHNDVKHTKEVLNMKVKQSEAFETSTENKLEIILGEVKDLKSLRNMTDAHFNSTSLKLEAIIEDIRNNTDLFTDNHNVLNSEVKNVVSKVESLQEITKDFKNNDEKSTCRQDPHFNSTILKLEKQIKRIRLNTEFFMTHHDILKSKVESHASRVESLQEITKYFKNNDEKSTCRQDPHFNSTKLKLETIVGDLQYGTDLIMDSTNEFSSNANSILSGVESLQEIAEDFKNNYEKSASRQENCEDIGSSISPPSDLTAKNSAEGLTFEDILNNKISNFSQWKTCERVALSLISSVNFFFHLNTSQYAETVNNLERCWWKVLPETMKGFKYFITPKLRQTDAVQFCYDEGAKPFVPKNYFEFLYYVAVTAEPKNDHYSWYVINDIEFEGYLAHNDVTDYESASYKPKKWSEKWTNSKEADCVTVDIFGEASWSRCFQNYFVLLCQKPI